ncbi:hypothetical protein ACS0TY_008197 [Phlomoides rotata]
MRIKIEHLPYKLLATAVVGLLDLRPSPRLLGGNFGYDTITRHGNDTKIAAALVSISLSLLLLHDSTTPATKAKHSSTPLHDTKYYYEIGNGDSSRKFWFQTPPEIGPDSSYKFGIIDDLGQTYNSLSTLKHSLQTGAQTILFVGDLSYADRYDKHDVSVRWDSDRV